MKSSATKLTDSDDLMTPKAAPVRRSRRRASDRLSLISMVGFPAFLHIGLVWIPALLSVILSFTRWNGIGGVDNIEFVGIDNYKSITTINTEFVPALTNNVLWLVVLMAVSTPLGLLLAVLLDKNLKGGRFYQSALYMPVMLSLAVVGFIWELIYSRETGVINAALGSDVDWLGNQSINIWAILVAAIWRHTGYVMILYLAGLKGVDKSLKEAAAIDGASSWQAFRDVVFPVMKPVNIVILVITTIESLRAFDIVDVINGGRFGLELISVLITRNVGGAASRVGYGSALAVILMVVSLVPIISFLSTNLRKEQAS